MYKSKGEKNISIQLVKDDFLKYKMASRNELAERTHLSLATITNVLKELQAIQFIERIEDSPSTGGRKAKRYIICGQHMLFCLISLQVIHKQVKVGLRIVDLNYACLYHQELYYQYFHEKLLIDIIKNMKEQYHFLYMSLSVPGIVDHGYVTQCDIEELENSYLMQIIEEQTDVHVVVENDVNTAMLGYVHTQATKQDSIAFVYQPDNHYSGCSLYVNNAIVYGATHFAGELGYLPNGTLQEQVELLKKNPLELLLNQIVSVIAIINPSHMVIYSPQINQDKFYGEIGKYIPVNHQPLFQFIDTMDEYIFSGLTHECVENSRYKTRREENEC